MGLQTGENPFVQSVFGPAVTDETKALIDEARAAIVDGTSVFTGPVTAQDGTVAVPEGGQLSYDEVEQMDFFVAGVTRAL